MAFLSRFFMGAIVRHSLLDKRHRTPFVFSTNAATNIIAKCVGFPKAVKQVDFRERVNWGFTKPQKRLHAARAIGRALRGIFFAKRNKCTRAKSSRLGPIAMHFVE
ncbi:MAG: hypothetical protein DBX56_03920 [Coriobacteriia bacterium]|nr:MAG: hypothetical protein DBX56_03920 [Coriobacteriia bacterium]